MSLGQTMLMVMFLALTMIMIVNALNTLNNADIQVLTAESYKTAADLGQSLMAEIVTKKYDQFSDPTRIQGPYQGFPGNFTYTMGTGGTTITLPDVAPFQSISQYNDVDDYNGYSRITESTNGLGAFRDSVIVYYVNTSTNPPKKTSTQQWTKQIEVWVTSDN
jgi:hypothetical protein